MTSDSKESFDEKATGGRRDEPATYNVFRDSALRYMGYSNEIGESFRYQFPRLVVPTYVLAFGYCTMDAVTNGYETWTSEPTFDKEQSREMKTAVTTFDTMLWQSLASVMIPGATINTIVKASRFAVARTTLLPVAVAKWLPTCFGLGSIPFIVEPIDEGVDYLLDNTTRPLMREGGSAVLEDWLSGNGQTVAAFFKSEKPRGD